MMNLIKIVKEKEFVILFIETNRQSENIKDGRSQSVTLNCTGNNKSIKSLIIESFEIDWRNFAQDKQ